MVMTHKLRHLGAAFLLGLVPPLSAALADATLPPVKLPPVTADTRAPQASDDSTVPHPNGAQWLLNGAVWKLGDNTAQYATWSRIESKALPLDVIGLHISAAALNANGSGYAANEVLTFAGGVQVKILTVSAGAPATWSITAPNWHACAPANWAGLTQLSTTGSGSGATWNFTALYPTAYGTRLLSRCYNGYALRAVRSDTAETRDIGFLADGALDTPNLDAFAQGTLPPALSYTLSDAGLVVPRLSIWYDQGAQLGNAGNSATQTTAANRPTLFPGRRLGNARSVMFDAGTSTNWAPATTSMTLPAGVALVGNNSTVAALSGHMSQYQIGTAPVMVGSTASSGYAVGISFHSFSAGSRECDNGSSGAINAPNYLPTDTPQFEKCINGASSTIYTNNTQQLTFSAGPQIGSSSTATGGSLGVPGNGRGGSGLLDLAAVILVPWALDANTAAMLDAAIYRAFDIAPQMGAMIVAGCDSRVSGYGTTFQQSWPRQMVELLGRRDLQLVDFGQPGASVKGCYVDNFWLPQTALQGTNVQRWVVMEGGYNDLSAGRSVAQLEADYVAGAANIHAQGAKIACSTDPMSGGSPAGFNTQMQTVNAWLRANTGGFCDLVIDPAAAGVFNSLSAWPTPWYEQQDGGIHLSSQGNALWAAIAAQAFKGVLQ
jgi:hypothetical protein